jgi:hypothetical protein
MESCCPISLTAYGVELPGHQSAEAPEGGFSKFVRKSDHEVVVEILCFANHRVSELKCCVSRQGASLLK